MDMVFALLLYGLFALLSLLLVLIGAQVYRSIVRQTEAAIRALPSPTWPTKSGRRRRPGWKPGRAYPCWSCPSRRESKPMKP